MIFPKQSSLPQMSLTGCPHPGVQVLTVHPSLKVLAWLWPLHTEMPRRSPQSQGSLGPVTSMDIAIPASVLWSKSMSSCC